MARLNEPPMSADNADIIRRKLLRQNRELARKNADHLKSIRDLQAENSKLLSEKLELRSRVIQLEQKVEDNSSRRIAEQVLDIRARLEAQLLDCVNILGDLTDEPPRKRHAGSPKAGRNPKPRQSMAVHRSPPRRRLDESARDAELRALSEGRLPPISESKSYPRRTMDRNEILALCSEAADTTDSPELGPPPMSRFVDVEADPVKAESPSKQRASPLRPTPSSKDGGERDGGEMDAASPPVFVQFKTTSKPAKEIAVKPDPPTEVAQPSQAESECDPGKLADPSRTSSKRKFGAGESASDGVVSSLSEPPKPRITSTIRSDRKNEKTLKELATMRREAQERLAAPPSPRKALSEKNINQEISSPKKATGAKHSMGNEPAKFDKPKHEPKREKPKMKSKKSPQDSTITICTLAPAAPEPVAEILPEIASETVPSEAALLSPRSPEPSGSNEEAKDTPPPVDISSRGETARGSRRARAAVSYAEPNLRDKMRRPGKELFDAVTGEGRHRSRVSGSKSEEPPSAEPIQIKHESDTDDAWKRLPGVIPSTGEALSIAEATSPLADKKLAPGNLEAPKANRKTQTLPATLNQSEPDLTKTEGRNEAGGKGSRSSPSLSPAGREDTDPYDFSSSTPGSEPSTESKTSRKSTARRQSKSSRRLSSVAKEDFMFDTDEKAEKPKTTASRKRASMAHSRTEATSQGNADSASTDSASLQQDAPSRSSTRRKSMMV